MHGRISLWKNEVVDPDGAAAGRSNIFDRKHAEIYREYQSRLHKAGAMDFDDLLVNTVRLLRDHPDVLEHYRHRFQYILVDEYQDTNQAQNEIVLLLAGGHHNVTVVGDTDQCLPGGTLVRTPTGETPIEALRWGIRWSAPPVAPKRGLASSPTSTAPRARRPWSDGASAGGRSSSSPPPTTSCRPDWFPPREHISCTSCSVPIGATASVEQWCEDRRRRSPSTGHLRSQQPGARRRVWILRSADPSPKHRSARRGSRPTMDCRRLASKRSLAGNGRQWLGAFDGLDTDVRAKRLMDDLQLLESSPITDLRTALGGRPST